MQVECQRKSLRGNRRSDLFSEYWRQGFCYALRAKAAVGGPVPPVLVVFSHAEFDSACGLASKSKAVGEGVRSVC
jgi:hypothetical protein